MGRKIRIEVGYHPDRQGVEHHTTSEPFAMSPRNGLLVHRVRYRKTFKHPLCPPWHGSHDAVHYWCGNFCCDPLMFYEPPAGRMVCAKCEAEVARVAARRGKSHKRAADLAGRTVHLGSLVVVKVGTQRVTRS